MESKYQLHVPAVILLAKQASVHIEYLAAWATEQVLTLWIGFVHM